MLPYQEDKKLERLLKDLYLNDDEIAADDVAVLDWPIVPILLPSFNCCVYNYSNYSG